MTWLAAEAPDVPLPLSSDHSLAVSPQPMTIASPVSFLDPDKTEAPVDVDLDDEWDEFDDEDEGA